MTNRPDIKPSESHAGTFDQTPRAVLRCDDLITRSQAVAAVAARHAVDVDHNSCFPREAIESLRDHRLLGILVPQDLGGEGATISQTADICYRLGRACASTAMIYAMHQTKVACLVRHKCESSWHEQLLQRLCSEQLLLASSTTEGQEGGNVRWSSAAIERDQTGIRLKRDATVISYGAYADGIVTTARRSADAANSDQVLVVFLKENYSLEPLVGWDTLGMRGTCSSGFTLVASGESTQILPEPYEKIHALTMTPVSHLTWASVWAGIAASAVERAQTFVRKAARQTNGKLPPGATQFTTANSSLQVLREIVASALRRYEFASNNARELTSINFQTAINVTKIQASELAVSTVMSAFYTCGLSGYRNDREFSVGRHLRDILSSPIMINNERIRSNMSNAMLLSAISTSLFD
jgi:acyl-CoA dehydrogenase